MSLTKKEKKSLNLIYSVVWPHLMRVKNWTSWRRKSCAHQAGLQSGFLFLSVAICALSIYRILAQVSKYGLE